jgi:hypothetical protein
MKENHYLIAFYTLLSLLLLTIVLTVYSANITSKQTEQINEEIEDCKHYLKTR